MTTAADDEDVVIDLTLRDYLSTSADRAAREMEDLTRNTKQASRALLLFDRRVERATRSLNGLTAALEKYNLTQGRATTVIEQATRQTQQYSRGMDRTGRALNRTTNAVGRNEKALRRQHKALKMIIPVAMRTAAVLGMVSVAMVAIAAVSAGGAAIQTIVQIGAALSSLLSFAALLPTALGGLITTIMSLVVAFNGLGTAIGAAFSGDTAALNEALKNLSPEARKFVKEFMPFIKQMKEIGKVVQDSLFKPLVGSLKPFLKAVLPLMQSGMKETAEAFGFLLRELLDFLKSAEGLEMIQNFFRAGISMLKAFSVGLKPLMAGFAKLVDTVAPYWDRFMVAISEGMAKFGYWLDRISTSGQLEAWLDTAIATAGQLFEMFGMVLTIFGNISRAAGGAEGAFAPIMGFLAKIEEWTSSAAGQEAMTTFFRALEDIFNALAPILIVVAEAIGTVLAPAIRDIVVGLAPGFTEFLKALADGLSKLGPFWTPLAEAVGLLLEALAPLLPVLGNLIGMLGVDIIRALVVLTPAISNIVNAVSRVLGPAFEAIADVLARVAPYLVDFIEGMIEAFEPLMPVLDEIGALFAEIFVEVGQTIVDMLPEILPMLLEMGKIMSEEMLNALKELMPFLPPLARAFTDLLIAITPMIPDLIRLAFAFIDIFYQIEPNLPMILGLTWLFLRLATVIAGFVSDTVSNIADFMTKMKELKDDVVDKLEGIKKWFKDAFESVKNTVLGVINNIQEAIDGISFEGLGNRISGFFDSINPFRAFGGDVEAGVKYTVGEIGPELFVPDHGLPQMIGVGGMETRSFGSDGVIIPSFMLDAMEKMEDSMSRQLSTVGGGGSGSETDALAAAVKAVADSKGGDEYNININVGAVRSDDDIKKIKKVVKQVFNEIERDRKERE